MGEEKDGQENVQKMAAKHTIGWHFSENYAG